MERQRRPSPRARGYSSAWDRRAKRFIEANPICFGLGDGISCGKQAELVDHRLAKRDGGLDEWSNMQSLCRSCHGRKTALEVRMRRRRVSRLW